MGKRDLATIQYRKLVNDDDCKNSSNTKGNILNNPYMLMSIIVILWGSFAAVSKLALKSIDSLQVQFYMFGIAFIVMTIWLLSNGKIKELAKLSKPDYVRLTIYALPSFFYYVLYLLSMKFISVVEASMLNYLFPIMIVIFAVPINKEKLNGIKIASLLIGFLGVLVILSNGNLHSIKMSNLKGDFLAISASILWGIFSNLGKKNTVDTNLSNYIFTFVTFVLSGICMLAFSKFTIPTPFTMLGILWLSLSNIVFSYYLWFRALKVSSAALIASLSYVTPFVTLVFIMLLLREKVSWFQVSGLIVIILGTAVQSIFPIKSLKGDAV